MNCHYAVQTEMVQASMNTSFRRALVDNKITDWHNIVSKKPHIQLLNEKDSFTWDLHKHSQFSVPFS